MIPLQWLPFEQDSYQYREDCQRNSLLDNLQLHNVERTAVLIEPDPVGRHLGAIFEECQSPRKQNDEKYRPARGNLHFLQLEMPIPGESHKNIGYNQQSDCQDSLHIVNNSTKNRKQIRLNRQKLLAEL